jgi:hypothetical protein
VVAVVEAAKHDGTPKSEHHLVFAFKKKEKKGGLIGNTTGIIEPVLYRNDIESAS